MDYTEDEIREFVKPALKEEIVSIQENTDGADHHVFILTTPINRFVLKIPKNDSYFRIQREILGCTLLEKVGIQVPKIIFANDVFLIETFIEGISLQKLTCKKETQYHIFYKVGQILKQIHTVPGQKYGMVTSAQLKGKFNSSFEYLESYIYHEIDNLVQSQLYSSQEIQKIQKYFKTKKYFLNDTQSVLLHGDYFDSNLIWTPNEHIAVIDFGDLSCGNPMQDCAYLYTAHANTEKFMSFLNGYENFDLKSIEFFSFCQLTWLIPLLWKKKSNPE